MSAQPLSVPPVPQVRALLDGHFDRRTLAHFLGTDDEGGIDLARRALMPALADFLARPGKEFRSRVVEHAFEVARAVGPTCACAYLPPELPAIVELLHAGSLVIDDIEDDAKSRRGAPALHRIHGVPIALNAGNWLYFWPFVLLSKMPLEPSTALAMHRKISATLLRCHHGQAVDLGVRITDLARHEIPAAVDLCTRLKTGSLFELAGALGAIAAHATPAVERAITVFAREVGVVLQIADDVSSILSPARRAKAHEDLLEARPTWPWAWLAKELSDDEFRPLQELAGEVVEGRVRPDVLVDALRPRLEPWARRRAREHLDHAITDLRNAVGDGPVVERLIRDVRGLEHAHG